MNYSLFVMFVPLHRVWYCLFIRDSVGRWSQWMPKKLGQDGKFQLNESVVRMQKSSDWNGLKIAALQLLKVVHQHQAGTVAAWQWEFCEQQERLWTSWSVCVIIHIELKFSPCGDWDLDCGQGDNRPNFRPRMSYEVTKDRLIPCVTKLITTVC